MCTSLTQYFLPENNAVLEKNELRPWLKRQWCFPRPGADFVWRMEDVLDVYCRLYKEHEPVVCLDEMGKILVKEKHAPEAAKPGQDRREDYTYEKKGQRNLFIACEPLGGKRYLKVTAVAPSVTGRTSSKNCSSSSIPTIQNT